MKKIYIVIFIIVFAIGFKAGDYESEGKYKHLATNTEIFFKNLFSKDKKKIPQEKIKELRKNPKTKLEEFFENFEEDPEDEKKILLN